MNALDRWALEVAVRHRTPGLTTCFEAVTRLGSSGVLVPLLAAVAVAVWLRTRRPSVFGLVAAYVLASLSVDAVKAVIGRTRPPAASAIGTYHSASMPSGHATQSVVAWGLLAALAWRSTSSRGARAACVIAVLAICALVGASRVYLGAHWLTDVLAGWTLGAAWVAVVVVVATARRAADREDVVDDRA